MVKQADILRVLNDAGWRIVRTRDHHILTRQDGSGRVIVPLHREITSGTFRNILKQADLTIEEYERLRKE